MNATVSRRIPAFSSSRTGLTDHFRSQVAHGLIARGQFPNSQRIQEWICDELERNADHVDRHGHCGRACDFDGMEQTASGETVCRWTRLPCPKAELSLIVSLFSIPNRRTP